jgi:hypothetical protein
LRGVEEAPGYGLRGWRLEGLQQQLRRWLEVLWRRLEVLWRRLELLWRWLELLWRRLEVLWRRLEVLWRWLELLWRRLELLWRWLELLWRRLELLWRRREVSRVVETTATAHLRRRHRVRLKRCRIVHGLVARQGCNEEAAAAATTTDAALARGLRCRSCCHGCCRGTHGSSWRRLRLLKQCSDRGVPLFVRNLRGCLALWVACARRRTCSQQHLNDSHVALAGCRMQQAPAREHAGGLARGGVDGA